MCASGVLWAVTIFTPTCDSNHSRQNIDFSRERARSLCSFKGTACGLPLDHCMEHHCVGQPFGRESRQSQQLRQPMCRVQIAKLPLLV